mmetsp:Transcript_45123/g.144512  ORF Transcript_45123/g.144512 Transcript_45123/m.144512 type:complete len:202 (+) Transcript_45123:383-988(+)
MTLPRVAKAAILAQGFDAPRGFVGPALKGLGEVAPRPALVIVDVREVAQRRCAFGDLVPATRGIDEPRRVQLPQPLHVGARLELSPTLVEQHPHHDRGEGRQPRHHRPQLRPKGLQALGCADDLLCRGVSSSGICLRAARLPRRQHAAIPGGHILPDQEPEYVAEHVEGSTHHHGMHPDCVEARSFDGSELLLQRLVARWT